MSKEEIEKAKKKLNKPKKYDLIEIIRIFKRNGIENYCVADNKTIQILLQYISQLEQENKALKKGQTSLMSSRKKWKDRYYKEKGKFNKLNKINNEMAKEINKAYFDEEDFWLWFEKDIINETSNLPERIIKIKQYFEEKVEGNK